MTRRPVIAGLSRGAGTSTLAAALHAEDGGRLDRSGHGGADIVLCRAGAEPLRRAAGLVRIGPGPLPVLAVAAGGTGGHRPARLHDLAPRFGAVVLLPHVPCWQGLADPAGEAAGVLTRPSGHLSRPLRGYASGLRRIVDAVLASGVLDRPAPVTLAVPQAVAARPVLRPVPGSTPLRPVPATVPARPLLPPAPHRRAGADVTDLDDDQLEAELAGLLAAVGRAG